MTRPKFVAHIERITVSIASKIIISLLLLRFFLNPRNTMYFLIYNKYSCRELGRKTSRKTCFAKSPFRLLSSLLIMMSWVRVGVVLFVKNRMTEANLSLSSFRLRRSLMYTDFPVPDDPIKRNGFPFSTNRFIKW